MPVQILIDGYNLLFTAGFEGRGRGRGWLGQARQRLLKHLEANLSPELIPNTLVVFDVSADVMKDRDRDLDQVPGSTRGTTSTSGIQVTFAFDFEEADDMLENLIRKHSSPKNLTVVSSDNRIRKCALARRAISVGSDEFLDWLDHPESALTADSDSAGNKLGNQLGNARASEDEPRKEDLKLSESEVQEWLREFGGG